MSRRGYPNLLWSPHERDTFAIGSSDGQHLRFYRFSGEDRGEHSLGDNGGDQHLGVQLLGGTADMQLKCMAWCPHVAHPWTFAVGTNSGRLVLHDCTPGNTLGSSASGRPTTAVCEFVPRIGPRVCFSAAWNPLQPLQVAAGLDKVRGAFGVLVWDVTRAAATSTACEGAAGTLEAASSAVSARASSLPSLGALTGQPMALSALPTQARRGVPDFSSCTSFDLSAMGAVPTVWKPNLTLEFLYSPILLLARVLAPPGRAAFTAYTAFTPPTRPVDSR